MCAFRVDPRSSHKIVWPLPKAKRTNGAVRKVERDYSRCGWHGVNKRGRLRLKGRCDMPIAVKLDDLLHDRRMTLTELADRVGMTLANRASDRQRRANGEQADGSR